MRKSSSNSEHAALVTVGWDDSGASFLAARICDANVDNDEQGEALRGVAVRGWDPRPSYVYRCNIPALRQEAAAVARNLAQRVRPFLRAVETGQKYAGVYAGGDYDWGQAAKSVTKFKYVDKASTAFVDACYEVAYPPSHGPRNTVLPGMFCSGFIVVCYMVAAKKIDHGGKGVGLLGNLNVDPRAISPKALQSLLERNTLFSRIGRPYHDAT